MVTKTASYSNYRRNGFAAGRPRFTCRVDRKRHAAISRNAATQGMVLLKNEGRALPLDAGTRIALYGVAQHRTLKGGGGSGDVHAEHTVSLVEGLQAAGYELNSVVAGLYPHTLTAEPAVAAEDIKNHAKADDCDLAMLTISRPCGEGHDRTAEKGDFYLSDTESRLMKDISAAYHAAGKKFVVLLNIGAQVETASWRESADAILLTWMPGQECGHAMADVLSGRVNPSGKLPHTFPIRYEDDPTAANFPGDGRRTFYREGLYVGYRYYSTFGKPVAYEFGFGLSYTEFHYDDVQLDFDEQTNCATVRVSVTNTGEVPGREAVQLYVSYPEGPLEQPALQLKSFNKTGLLAPGDTQELCLNMSREELRTYNPQTAAWVIPAGQYKLLIGASSKDIRAERTISVPRELVVEQVANRASTSRRLANLSAVGGLEANF